VGVEVRSPVAEGICIEKGSAGCARGDQAYFCEPHAESLKASLGRDQLRLYTLIWSRFMASQMSDAVKEVTSVDISAGKHRFRATGQKMKFDGFTVIYTEGRDDENSRDEDKRELPALEAGQGLDLVQLLPKQHFTQPPPRYTEATLVKELRSTASGGLARTRQ